MRLLSLSVAGVLAGCVAIPGPAPSCDPGEDADGDGWRCDGPVPDCDDHNSDVNPGARDIPGTDRNCDGAHDGPLKPPTAVNNSIDIPGYSIRFPAAGVYPFPYQIMADSTPLLYQGADPEHAMGFFAAPEYFSTAGGNVNNISLSDVDARITFQIEEDKYNLGGNGNVSLVSMTRLTIWPDARIVRHDVIAVTGTLTADDLASYLALDASAFTRADFNGTSMALQGATGAYDVGAASTPGSVCVWDEQSGRAIVMSWLNAGLGPRVRFGGGRVALESRLAGSAPVGLSRHDAYTMYYLLNGFDFEVCHAGKDQASVFQAPPIPSVQGGSLVMNDSGDRDGDGYVDDGGFYAVESTGPEVSLSFPTAMSGVAIRVKVAGSEHGITVWEDSRLRRDFEMLAESPSAEDTSGAEPGTWMVWLKRVSAGSTIRILGPEGAP